MPTLEFAPSLKNYDRAWLSNDIVGGLAAGAVVIPQAMAYATIAGLPVQVGLYTCMVPMLVYALLGGSRTLSVSTTSTIAVLTGSTLIAAEVASESADPAKDLATLTLMVGVILLVARLLRAGALIDNISEATLVGIKIGVGLTVASSQLPKLLGITGDPDASNFFGHMEGVFDQIGDTSVVTLVFSLATLAVLIGIKRFVPRIPGPLVAVVGGILLVAVGNIDEHGVALIAPVPSGLPAPIVPEFDRIEELLPGAFAIAIMVMLETLAVAPRYVVVPSQRSTTIRSSSPTASRARRVRSSGRCPRRAVSRRRRSTRARAPAPSSVSSSPSCSPSPARCSWGACSATSHKRRSVAW